MTKQPLTRRAFLRASGAVGAGLLLSAALAARTEAALLPAEAEFSPAPTATALADPYSGVVPLRFPIRRGLYWIYNNWHAPRVGPILSYNHQVRSWLRAHDGVDIYAPVGVTLYACVSGTVVDYPRPRYPYGNYVWIQNAAGYRFFYCHLQKVYVRAGQKVDANTPIGTVGKTGNAASTPSHLHFELHYPVGNIYACKHCAGHKRVGAINPYPSLRAATPRT